jgi:uncharacterized membrane protein YbhN (UPF0104 family)
MKKRLALQVAGCIVALVVLGRLFVHADVGAMGRALISAGPLVLLGLAPFALGMTLDAWGVVQILRGLGHRTTLAQMLPVRLASEALHVTLPAGFVAADTATAVFLEKRCGVPLGDGIVASVARKWLVMRSHGLYIALGGVAGYAALEEIARALGMHALPWLVVSSAAVPLALSAGLGATLLARSSFARVHALLARIPSRRVARWLESRRHDVVATDAQVTRLRGARGPTTAAMLAFLGCWCFEALETALLLHLVGARVDLVSVFAAEAGLSMVRSVIVFAPSGLGVVDVGYAAVMQALGVDPAASAALVVLRRAKEAVWVAVGFALMTAIRRGVTLPARPAPLGDIAPPRRPWRRWSSA